MSEVQVQYRIVVKYSYEKLEEEVNCLLGTNGWELAGQLIVNGVHPPWNEMIWCQPMVRTETVVPSIRGPGKP